MTLIVNPQSFPSKPTLRAITSLGITITDKEG